MEAQVSFLREQKAKSQNNHNSTPKSPSWYQTPLGIMGIVATVIVVSGAILYLTKPKINLKKRK